MKDNSLPNGQELKLQSSSVPSQLRSHLSSTQPFQPLSTTVTQSANARHLTLLLEPASIATIAQQLWTLHNRLSIHTAGNIPSPAELAIALRLYMERCDKERARNSNHHIRPHPLRAPYRDQRPVNSHQPTQINAVPTSTLIPHDAPSLPLLGRLLSICDATYLVCDQTLLVQAFSRIPLPPPLAFQREAKKWAPSYLVVYDDLKDALILSIRGSRESGDLLTNLSFDCEPFLQGVAHQGVVKSAQYLHDRLRPLLATQLVRRKPKSGLFIIGHSLGAAVASALTMLLSYTPPVPSEPSYATVKLATASCFAFCPPPFLDYRLSRKSRKSRIVSVAYNLDVVSRLSPASVDRLLHKLSAYDFSSHIPPGISRLVHSANSAVRERRNANNPNQSVSVGASRNVNDANALSGVSDTLAEIANLVLESQNTESSREPERSAVPPNRSPLWNTALSAVFAATRMIGHGIESNAARRAERRLSGAYSAGLAAPTEFSMNDVNRILDRGLPEMYLAGEVWHMDRQFILPRPNLCQDDWPVPTLVRRDPSFFTDIEVSAWMISDHSIRSLGQDLNRLASSQTINSIGPENSSE